MKHYSLPLLTFQAIAIGLLSISLPDGACAQQQQRHSVWDVVAASSDRDRRRNLQDVYNGLPGAITPEADETSQPSNPLLYPANNDGAEIRANDPAISEGLPRSATPPSPTPPPGLAQTQPNNRKPLPRRITMIPDQRELRDVIPSVQNVQSNLQTYFKGDPEALVICEGALVQLANIIVSGVLPYDPVYSPNGIVFLRSTIYYRGIVPTGSPQCPGVVIDAEIDAVRLAADNATSYSPGVWYIPTWRRSLAERQ